MCSMSTDRNKGRISLAKETLPTFFTQSSNNSHEVDGRVSTNPAAIRFTRVGASSKFRLVQSTANSSFHVRTRSSLSGDEPRTIVKNAERLLIYYRCPELQYRDGHD